MGTLAAEDIFLRDNLLAQGLLSIFWHGAICYFLFLLLQKVLSTKVAAALTFYFLVQFIGMEMIYWRHISPYSLSALFLLAGVLAATKQRRKMAVALFLTACLFHEIAALALILFCVWAFLFGERRFRYLAWAPTLYVAINITDYFCHHSPPLIGASDRGISQLSMLPYCVLVVAGAHTYGNLFSFLVPLNLNWTFGKMFWSFTRYSSLAALIGGVMCVFAALYLLRKRKGKSFPLTHVVNVAALSFFLSLVLGLALGRGTQRGLAYLEGGTQYFYFSNLAFVILAAMMLRAIATSKKNQNLAIACVLLVSFANLIQLERTLAKDLPYHESVASLVSESAFFFRTHDFYCLQPSTDPRVKSTAVDLILRTFRCEQRPEVPLTIMIDTDRHYALVNSIGGTVIRFQAKLREQYAGQWE
jgi:hypothetical protein